MTEPKKPPITKSFGYAFEGIFTCIRRERNMKIHCVMAVLVVIAGVILELAPVEWCICLALFGMVMALELVNTTDSCSIYTCNVLLNDEIETNLRIEYDWEYDEWSVIGIWDGIDEETGMASREVYELQDGDVITPAYYWFSPMPYIRISAFESSRIERRTLSSQ